MPALQLPREWHKRIFGMSTEFKVSTRVNDTRYHNIQGISACCHAPAGANAQTADEWLDLHWLMRTAKVLGELMLNCRGVSS